MIIGITGRSGAGKDVAAEYIGSKLKYRHISGGEVIRGVFTQLGLTPTRAAVGDFAQLLRVHFGADAIIKAVAAMSRSENVIISGFRSSAETKMVQDSGGFILHIDALPEVRRQRLLLRARPGDPVTDEEFAELDARESDGGVGGEDIEAIKATADAVIANNGSLDDMYREIERVLPVR